MDPAEHIDAFNRAVAAGDWDAFVQRFADDATLAFVPYRWVSTDATGTMRLTEAADGRIARLVVTFD